MANLKSDRRSQRTQRILHEALMSLMQEKRYEDITVQDIIERADVGRSTFYSHYQDKEDLMTSGLIHFMEIFSNSHAHSSTPGDLHLLPTKELLDHVQQNLNVFKGMMSGRGVELFFEKGQEYWVQNITNELQAQLREGEQPVVPIPLLASLVAGTFITMLRWWINKKMPYSPDEMDMMLQRFIQPGVEKCLQVSAQ
jgi:AcrR family transcriptional regulator